MNFPIEKLAYSNKEFNIDLKCPRVNDISSDSGITCVHEPGAMTTLQGCSQVEDSEIIVDPESHTRYLKGKLLGKVNTLNCLDCPAMVFTDRNRNPAGLLAPFSVTTPLDSGKNKQQTANDGSRLVLFFFFSSSLASAALCLALSCSARLPPSIWTKEKQKQTFRLHSRSRSTQIYTPISLFLIHNLPIWLFIIYFFDLSANSLSSSGKKKKKLTILYKCILI